jgi:hypothetical protein
VLMRYTDATGVKVNQLNDGFLDMMRLFSRPTPKY